MAKPELVTHDAFYMKELNEMVDLKVDYDRWRSPQRVDVSELILLITSELSFLLSRLRREFHFVIIHFYSI